MRRPKNVYVHERMREVCDPGDTFTCSELMGMLKIKDRRYSLTYGQLRNFLQSYDDVRIIERKGGRATYERVRL